MYDVIVLPTEMKLVVVSEVAAATPRTGVTSVGEVASTTAPVPVKEKNVGFAAVYVWVPVVVIEPLSVAPEIVGLVARTTAPVPVCEKNVGFTVVNVAAPEIVMLPDSVAPLIVGAVSNTTLPVPVVPVTVVPVIWLALIVPVGANVSDAPDPTTIAAVVLVPDVRSLNAVIAPLDGAHDVPLHTSACPVVRPAVLTGSPVSWLTLIVPEPEKLSDAPLPTTIAATVFVPLVMSVNVVRSVPGTQLVPL